MTRKERLGPGVEVWHFVAVMMQPPGRQGELIATIEIGTYGTMVKFDKALDGVDGGGLLVIQGIINGTRAFETDYRREVLGEVA